jgi:hypothetical protein
MTVGVLSIVVCLFSMAAGPVLAAPAYLSAHMTKSDYGHLYYSVSEDGLHWKLLNQGRRVFDEYRGHPDICKGPGGRYYLLGNHPERPDIRIWSSGDLIHWALVTDFLPDLSELPEFRPPRTWHGAPKMFYDDASGQFLITWHSTTRDPDPKSPEAYWSGMRTLYVTSKDLKSFSVPRRLFPFDFATIDVIVRRIGDRYYAVLKDERYPSFEVPTGKTIRISSAPSLTGPYSAPSPPVSPNFREAPNLIPRPDGSGWLLYYEQYPGVSYGLSVAKSMEGPWYDEYCMKYKVPEAARHGTMIAISHEQYEALLNAFNERSQAR